MENELTVFTLKATTPWPKETDKYLLKLLMHLFHICDVEVVGEISYEEITDEEK